jgi:hypothetical protein
VPELLAAIRPDDQSFALLLHLVGATVTFGALLASATCLVLARGETRLLRLLLVGLPGWILMRLAAEWLYRLQKWDELPEQIDQPAWLTIGHIVADWGGLLFLLALALGGVGIYRLRSGKPGTVLLNATMVIALLLIVAYVVAVWAMTGKPN